MSGSSRAWETDFVAMSAAIGEPIDAAGASLGSAGILRAGAIVRDLQAKTKSARAMALAMALAEVVSDLERMELR